VKIDKSPQAGPPNARACATPRTDNPLYVEEARERELTAHRWD